MAYDESVPSKYKHRKKARVIIVCVIIVIVSFALVELLFVKYDGRPVPEPITPRAVQTIGQGPKLAYVVMGDSTAVSQGGDYARGYAVQSAAYLAKTHTVAWANVAVAGARAKDTARGQLVKAAAFKPDIALVAVGANDVTHLTPLGSVRDSLATTIKGLRKANPGVHIILTGSPDMGTVPRFPQPLRWYAGQRTRDMNKLVARLAAEKNAVFAPIAEKTGPIFRQHPEYFASDKFHPNTAGYETWTPIIVDALGRT